MMKERNVPRIVEVLAIKTLFCGGNAFIGKGYRTRFFIDRIVCFVLEERYYLVDRVI